MRRAAIKQNLAIAGLSEDALQIFSDLAEQVPVCISHTHHTHWYHAHHTPHSTCTSESRTTVTQRTPKARESYSAIVVCHGGCLAVLSPCGFRVSRLALSDLSPTLVISYDSAFCKATR